jgi:uncharacterized membrane protein
MNCVSERRMKAPPGFSRAIHILLNTTFAVAFGVVWVNNIQPIRSLENSNWPEAVLLLTTTAAAISFVSRTLPFQNVLWGAFVIGCLGGLAHAVGTLASIPFGPFVYTDATGPRIFGVLPWAVPLIWILFIYTSRGVARLVLKRWRNTGHYGFWLMGITVLLSLILDLGLDPMASRLKHYWIWGPTRFPFDWHGTPFTNFAGWIVTALVIMAFALPMLINKKPGGSPEEFGTSAIWILLNVLFVTIALGNGFLLAAGLTSVATLVAGILIIRGARS